MADVWTCCQCEAANLIANSPERCPVCPHTRCDLCKTGRPTFSNPHHLPSHPNTYHTNSPVTQSYRYSPTTSSYMVSASRTPRYYTTTYPSSSSSSSYPPTATPTYNPSTSRDYASGRPSMRGWWVCCCCKQSWNPALASDRCPYDGHKRCPACVVLS